MKIFVVVYTAWKVDPFCHTENNDIGMYLLEHKIMWRKLTLLFDDETNSVLDSHHKSLSWGLWWQSTSVPPHAWFFIETKQRGSCFVVWKNEYIHPVIERGRVERVNEVAATSILWADKKLEPAHHLHPTNTSEPFNDSLMNKLIILDYCMIVIFLIQSVISDFTTCRFSTHCWRPFCLEFGCGIYFL